MTIPSKEVEVILFGPTVNVEALVDIIGSSEGLNFGDFNEISWLNTPGPIYTTYTDNCGTGQVEAMYNVGGDEDYHEVIFKQPTSTKELKETLTAAFVDPFGAYYFDGNANWTPSLIVEWWRQSIKRVNYVIDRYEEELSLPTNIERNLYGPIEPIPENYKNWLDFYQNGMKEYLEWYIEKLCNKKTILDGLNFDWTRKNALDETLKLKK